MFPDAIVYCAATLQVAKMCQIALWDHLRTSKKLLHQKYPQKCWEFHGNSSERPSLEPLLKKEAFPAILRGRKFGNALEASNALHSRVWGFPAVLSRGTPRKVLRAFPGSFWKFSGISSGKSQPYRVYGLQTCCTARHVFPCSDECSTRNLHSFQKHHICANCFNGIAKFQLCQQ